MSDFRPIWYVPICLAVGFMLIVWAGERAKLSDGWIWEPRPVMFSKPPFERIQFPSGQWYDLIGPPGMYECSRQQNGCRLLRETGGAPK